MLLSLVQFPACFFSQITFLSVCWFLSVKAKQAINTRVFPCCMWSDWWWFVTSWPCLSYFLYFTHRSGDEVLWWICLCICLSASISLEPRARSLLIFLCMLPVAMAWSCSSRVMKFQGKRAVLGVFFPTDNALWCVHCKGIIRSPITSCSRRGIIPYRCGVHCQWISRERVMGMHSAGDVWFTIALFLNL